VTALASLPTLSVQIAFNPTNLQTLTQTWTDVTQWVRDFSTNSGRQHFLDRIESSTIRMTLDNRTGYFLNGTTNGTGAVIRTRLPIKVTATVGATTYPIFWGLTETAEERTADQLNQDIILSATDNTKYLSLLYMSRPTFWATYAQSANAIAWYRCDTTQALPDRINSYTGSIAGAVANVAGSLLYDTDTAIDLTNGNASTNVAYLNLANPQVGTSGSTITNGIDFWFIGNQSQGQYIYNTVLTLYVTPRGTLGSYYYGTGATVDTNVIISDGNWHHIGLVQYTQTAGSAYPTYVYVDGQYFSIGTPPFPLGKNIQLGNYNTTTQAWQPATYYIDEIVVTGGVSALATIQGEIANRYRAGNLLNTVISSGDRIAEVLVLAGFGSITAGAIVPTNFYVNDSAWSANSGAFFVQNIQNPVTSSTALDLIQQVTDTDIGAFFQKPDGTFEFDDQAYLYTPTNNATPSGADIWSDTAASGVTTFYEPSTLQVLRDDADVWTTVQITAQNGTVQTYENTTAEPLYGYSTLTKSNVVSVTNEQANQEAIYLGNLYQSPLPRIGNVELRSETNNGANLTEMFKPYLNDQVLLNRTPNGASTTGTNPGAINSTMVIESIRHDFQADPGYWHSSFTLDPYPKRGQNSTPQTFFMLFDDATYGVFDSNNDYL